jgi:hypothetical protein
LGQITLAVQFGTADHFRIDYINFIVADFEGTYHAILGRPALAKFMVILHYVFLILKVPTEKGVLSLRAMFSSLTTVRRRVTQPTKPSSS